MRKAKPLAWWAPQGRQEHLGELLLRLYDQLWNGRLDGVDLRELNQQDLRSAIGLVSQEQILFHGTVADNIRYGSF